VRVVAETHSTLLLTAIQTLVAKGELSPDLVKLHWFQRDPKTGITQVNSTGLDENGAFREDWPEDFDEVILDTDRQYLDAVTDRSPG
jgi:predicted ATPase